jgi:Zn-finger nucleic acid-binding protein
MTERQGVEIDYCQQCRGVWLDRGELDKILDRAAAAEVPAAAPPPPAAAPSQPPPGWTPPPGAGWSQPAPQPPGAGWSQPVPPSAPPPGWRPDHDAGDWDDRRRYGGHHGEPAYGKRRKNWLSEFFD